MRKLKPHVVVAAALAVGGCHDAVVPPTSSPFDAPTGSAAVAPPLPDQSCTNKCVIARGDRVFASAAEPTDSVGASILLGRVTLEVAEGGRVELLTTGGFAARGRGAAVLVRINSREQRLPFDELRAGVEVYRAESATRITIEYRLPRGIAYPHGDGVTLLQQAYDASVTGARLPWANQAAADTPRPSLSVTGGTTISSSGDAMATCEIDHPTDSCEGLTTGINPYVADQQGFSSKGCCGYQVPITITFSRSVESVAITIGDPDYAGNSVVAYGADGAVIDQQSFVGDGVPGEFTSDTRTVSGGGISRLELIPDSRDYVYYLPLSVTVNAQITLVCSPSPYRGGDITCSASEVDPNQPLSVSGWTFRSSPAGDVVDRTTGQTERTWNGKLVTDGTVIVRGTVNGTVIEKQVDVAVRPRDWTGFAAQKQHTIIRASTMTLRPTGFKGQLGQTGLELKPDGDAAKILSVSDGGPNDGFVYLVGVPVISITEPEVNTNALAVGTEFYGIQDEKRRRVNGVTYCGKPYVTGIIPLIEEHEGFDPQAQPLSHAGIFRRHVDSIAVLNFEPVAGPGATTTTAPIITRVFESASADSEAMDNDARNTITRQAMGCDDFRYFMP